MRNGGRVLFAVLNFYVQIKIRVATSTLRARRPSIAASFQKLPDSVVKSAAIATDRVDVSGETIKLSISMRLVGDFFLHEMYIKDQQMLVFNFIFDLLWTGRGSSESSVAFLWFRQLK